MQVKFFRLCGSDFGITPEDDIPIGITWAAFCFHIVQFHSPVLSIFLFVGYCFVEIMCIRDSYVYQKGVLYFLFMKVMSGRLNSIVLPVSKLRFQYSLKLSFSST